MSDVKRLGPSTSDSSLEDRLLKIEQELNLKRLSNIEGSATANLRSEPKEVPVPKNVRIEQNIKGALFIHWTPVPISQLKYYEVEVSNTLAFSNDPSSDKVTIFYKTPQPEFLFVDGFDPDAIWYVRVRSVALNGKRSDWSIPSSSLIGRAVIFTEELDDLTSVGTLEVKANDPEVSLIMGNTDIIWNGGRILLFGILNADIYSFYYGYLDTGVPDRFIPCRIILETLRVHDLSDWDQNGPILDQNYKVIQSYEMEISYNLGMPLTSFGLPSLQPVPMKVYISGFSTSDDIASTAPFISVNASIGYRIRLKLGGNAVGNPNALNGIGFIPKSLNLQAVEVLA